MQVMSCCFRGFIGSVRRASDIVELGGIWGGEKLRIQRLLTRFEDQHSRFDNKIKGLTKIRVKWRIQVVM